MHVEHDVKLVYCDVNIDTFIFTKLTAKANIFFVLFDGKNVLQNYASNNFEFKKNNIVGMLSLESFSKLEHIVLRWGLSAPFSMFNISHMGAKYAVAD